MTCRGYPQSSLILGGCHPPKSGRIADLNEAAGAADARRELDGSLFALRLK
jgi:hypothetical protein